MFKEKPIVKIIIGIIFAAILGFIYYYGKIGLSRLAVTVLGRDFVMINGSLITIVIKVVLLSAGLIYILITKQNIKTVFSLKGTKLSYIVIAFFMGWALSLLNNSVGELFNGFRDSITDTHSYRNMDLLWMVILTVSLIGPILEELTFRGVIFNELKNKSYLWMAIVGQAVIFGLVHKPFLAAVFAFFMGIIAAILLLRTKSIYTAIAFHIGLNSFYFIFKLIFKLDVVGIVQNNTYIIIVGSFLLAGVLLWAFIKTTKLISKREEA